MKKIKIFIGILVTLLLTACGQPLPIDKADFIADWKNDNSRVNLIITLEGRVEDSNKQPGKSTSVSASIQEFDGHNFSVG